MEERIHHLEQHILTLESEKAHLHGKTQALEWALDLLAKESSAAEKLRSIVATHDKYLTDINARLFHVERCVLPAPTDRPEIPEKGS